MLVAMWLFLPLSSWKTAAPYSSFALWFFFREFSAHQLGIGPCTQSGMWQRTTSGASFFLRTSWIYPHCITCEFLLQKSVMVALPLIRSIRLVLFMKEQALQKRELTKGATGTVRMAASSPTLQVCGCGVRRQKRFRHQMGSWASLLRSHPNLRGHV